MTRISPVLLFLALVVIFATALQLTIAALGFSRHLVIVLMWSAGLSALATLKLTGQDFSSLGWKWGDARYHLIAFFAPLLYGSIAYFGANAAGLATFPSPQALAHFPDSVGVAAAPTMYALPLALFLTATAGMVGAMSTALGEEIGWRGFLQPRLTAMWGFLLATLVVGSIWACWHVPMVVFSDYNGGGDKVYEVASFVVMVVAGSGVYAWLRLQSGSFWPAVTLHASHNLFIQSVFDPLTVRGSQPITMVSEFGVVLAATVLVVSLPFWVLGMRRFKREAR